MSEGPDRVFVVGSGAHAGACAGQLAADGFDVKTFAPDMPAEGLAAEAEAGVPYGLVIALDEEFSAPEDFGSGWRGAVSKVLHDAYAQTRALARLIMRARRGRIVFVVSATGLSGEGDNSALAVASGAMAGMARSVARELAPRTVTVNTVAYGSSDPAPLGRRPSPEEAASMVGYLLSDAGAPICGQVLSVDSGLVMR